MAATRQQELLLTMQLAGHDLTGHYYVGLTGRAAT